MKITILGTGTSQGIPIIGCPCKVCQSTDPKNNRSRVSAYIEMENGSSFLIDCSPDLRQQFLANNITKVDAVLITHEHNDHIIGLDDLRPINFMQGTDLPLYALPRVIDDIKDRFKYIFKENPYPGAPRIETHALLHDSVNINGVEIQLIRYLHGTLPIVGFRIGDFAYLTDIKTIDQEEIDKLKGLKTLVVSALRLKPHFAHLNLEEAIDFAQKVDADQTYFTHMGHQLGLHHDLEEQLPDKIQPAYDGLVLQS